jgi:hypothetical protein
MYSLDLMPSHTLAAPAGTSSLPRLASLSLYEGLRDS